MADSRLGNSILRKLDSIEIPYDGDSWGVLHERIQEVSSTDKFVGWYKISFLSNVLGALVGTLAIGFQAVHTLQMEDIVKEETRIVEQSPTSDFVPAKDQSALNKVEPKAVIPTENVIPIENKTNSSHVTPDKDPAFTKPTTFLDTSEEELAFQTLKRNNPGINEVPIKLPDTLAIIPADSGLKKSRFGISVGINMLQSREMGVKPFWGMTVRSSFYRPRPFSYFVQTDFYSGRIAFSETQVNNSQGGTQILTRQEVSKEISLQSIRIGAGMEYLIKSYNRFALDISAGASADMIVSQSVETNVRSFHSDGDQEPFETHSTLKSSKIDPYFIPGISSSLGLHFGQLNGRFGATIPLSKLKESKQSLILWETKLMFRLN